MELILSVEKINKYAVRESGDTVEVIERPGGGLSLVIADGQSSGRGAKKISNMVTRKVISLLAEGVRDGAAARAASDYLFVEKHGKVSATLNIISVDLFTNTLVITRNNPAPVLISNPENITALTDPSTPIGLYRNTRPNIAEVPLKIGLTVIAYTDGIIHAGSRQGLPMDAIRLISDYPDLPSTPPQSIAEMLLSTACTLDQNRPQDDITVVVLGVRELIDEDKTRRMIVRVPLA